MMSSHTPDPPQFVRGLYTRGSDGEYLVYAGELRVEAGGEERTRHGRIELRIDDARPSLMVMLDTEISDIPFFNRAPEPRIEIPTGANLNPPGEPSAIKDASEHSIRLNSIESGNIHEIEYLILHISGDLAFANFPAQNGDSQGQVAFRLPGWELRIAHDPLAGRFPFAAHAKPIGKASISSEGVRELRASLFVLLSFLASREIGISPIVGLNGSDDVVWISFGAPRMLPKQYSATRWCPKRNVGDVLPLISDLYSGIETEPAKLKVLQRAINYYLSANGSGVLEVRLPVACSGLELLSWAVLQHGGWLTPDFLSKASSATLFRLLLKASDIPSTIPDKFSALTARRGRLGQKGMDGPEIVANVRNSIVHPPKKLEEPEWPSSGELFESLQLMLWYLELCLLRALGFNGEYSSRLDIDGWSGTLIPVPWSIGNRHSAGLLGPT